MTSAARTMTAALLHVGLAMILLAGTTAAQAPLFEVERSDATKLLQVSEDGGLVVRGQVGTGAIPATGGGVRLMWYPKKAAFRAGRVQAAQWDDGSIGEWSVAFGQNTTASGTHSVAMNGGTTASGDRSVALGGGSLASGTFSTAMGNVATASGLASTAMGDHTTASGAMSLATGFGSVAGGTASVAMGDRVAAGHVSVALGSDASALNGSFAFGDRSTNFPIVAAANTFMVRAFGGLGFNTGVNIGCDLPAGTGAWSCTSSRLAKEGFEDVDGEEVLALLAGIRIQRWRYLGTTAEHIGPTAEDFRAAFALGESSTKIATVDADGIALRAVQALERRTAELRDQNAALRAEVTALRAEIKALAPRPEPLR